MIEVVLMSSNCEGTYEGMIAHSTKKRASIALIKSYDYL